MSMLTNDSQRFLVESMRKSLIDSVKNTKTLTESVVNESTKFISEKATYEQLLNMTMNPLRESKYLPIHVLEGAVAILSEAMFTGRKVIGPNAIAQGAINLTEKTDCVITESMLDAAANACNKNSLKVISEAIVMEAGAANPNEQINQSILNRKIDPSKLWVNTYRRAFRTIRKQVRLLKSDAETPGSIKYVENQIDKVKVVHPLDYKKQDEYKKLIKELRKRKLKLQNCLKTLEDPISDNMSRGFTKKVLKQVDDQTSKGLIGHLGRHKLAYGAAAALAGGALAAKHFADKKNQEEQV